MKIYLLLLILQLLHTSSANVVVVECTFPCPSNQVCEVNQDFVKCQPITTHPKWILKNKNSLPDYQGTAIPFGEICMIAPQPKLQDASHLTANTSETILAWPNYDSYYSNCDSSLYCDKASICVKQLNHGEVCESNHQCLNGVCNQNTCQTATADDFNSGNPSSSGLSTVHLILTILGIILFLLLILGAYLYRRCKRKQKEQMQIATTKRVSDTPPSVEINIFDYASTPSRQQHELQLQLQKQINPPPPPYYP